MIDEVRLMHDDHYATLGSGAVYNKPVTSEFSCLFQHSEWGFSEGKSMKQLVKALTAIAGVAAVSGSVLAADAPAADAPVFDIGVEINGVDGLHGHGRHPP